MTTLDNGDLEYGEWMYRPPLSAQITVGQFDALFV